MAFKDFITQKELKEILHYNKETGFFTWKITRNQYAVKGEIAGYANPRGYVLIGLNGHTYLAHRLAFLYVEGCFPEVMIDHIDRNPTDNRFSNIRKSNPVENGANRVDNNEFVGVHKVHKYNKWFVQSGSKYLGYYKTHLAACYRRHSFNILGR